jgi:uncharacterized protein
VKTKYQKTIILLILTLITTLSFAGDKKSYVIATASAGGTFYPVGIAISSLVNNKLNNENIALSAITSAGSGENVQLLKSHEADFAILQGLFGLMAWQGKGKYEGKPEREMRAVTMLWENVEHFVIYSDYAKTENIIDLNNLKGERFSIGKRGSGTETSGITILSALGFDVKKDFEFEHLGYSTSATAMQDKRILGMNIPAGPPVSAITQAFAVIGSDKVTILNFSDEQIKIIKAQYPVWSRFIIPAETYPGQLKDINTIAQPNFLAVRPDISDDDVYQLLEAIYSNLDYLHKMHKATEAIKLDRAVNGLPIPLHPGAVKFYKDNGIEVPETLIN